MIKKIIPFERLIFSSTLQSQELMTHLQNEINDKEYSGHIYQNKFEIKRTINYRNSFLPVIKGEVIDAFNGSKINVKMDLNVFVKIFISIWLSIVFLVLSVSVYSIYFNNQAENNAVGLLIPLVMLVFGTLMAVLGFKYESKKSIKDLERILKGKLLNT